MLLSLWPLCYVLLSPTRKLVVYRFEKIFLVDLSWSFETPTKNWFPTKPSTSMVSLSPLVGWPLQILLTNLVNSSTSYGLYWLALLAITSFSNHYWLVLVVANSLPNNYVSCLITPPTTPCWSMHLVATQSCPPQHGPLRCQWPPYSTLSTILYNHSTVLDYSSLHTQLALSQHATNPCDPCCYPRSTSVCTCTHSSALRYPCCLCYAS